MKAPFTALDAVGAFTYFGCSLVFDLVHGETACRHSTSYGVVYGACRSMDGLAVG